MGRIGSLAVAPLAALAAERGQLFAWVPILLGCGIGIYFWAPVEPARPEYLLVAGLALAAMVALWRGGELVRIPAMALMLVATGFLVAGWRANSVAAPRLEFRYYGPIEGRITGIDRSLSDQLRITLDQVVLERLDPARTPAVVRIALHGKQPFLTPEPGLRVILSGHLSPPEGPVEPGGFDFQRLAWFSRLGAVGYTHSPVLVLEPADRRAWTLAVDRLRMNLSNAIQARIGGQEGALAAALMTGDRSGIDATSNEVMRASNLSHLISISGLHMGLLTGFVFLALRYGMALVPVLALRIPVKKVAAVVSLAAAAFYLALAGMNVATVRAFIMVAVMLTALLLDRRAITLRSVAIAAILILMMEPESLIEPGFQMSFAATAALVAGFAACAPYLSRLPPLLRPVATLLLSSLVAGAATAPIAAAHFNRVAEYGLLANSIAVPVTGLLVMPAGVMAGLLMPFGLEGWALDALGWGCRVILLVAEWVAGLKGAVWAVPTPPWFVLPLLASAALLSLLSRGALRLGGTVAFAAGFLFWTLAERPVLLIASDGALVGIMTDEGRALSKPTGAGFVAKSWLEDDGDLAAQDEAFARGAFSGAKGAMQGAWAGQALLHLTGKTAPERAVAACAGGATVVITGSYSGDRAGCRMFDADYLRDTGAVAIFAADGGMTMLTAREVAGDRLWNRRGAWPGLHRKAALAP